MSEIQNVLRSLPAAAGERKAVPVMTGVVDYFPLAIAEVARISKAGNDQHNPGQPLHWARGKSTDHADCVVRHLIERGTIDTDGQRHTAKAAWRMLALLQEELEAEAGWTPGPPAYVVPVAPEIPVEQIEKAAEAQGRYNFYIGLMERGVSGTEAWAIAHSKDSQPVSVSQESLAALRTDPQDDYRDSRDMFCGKDLNNPCTP